MVKLGKLGYNMFGGVDMSVLHLNKENFDEIIEKNDRVLVDFWAPWCGPCKMLGPVIEDLSNEISEVTFCKVNVDDEPDLASAFEVYSIPSVFYFEKGKVKNSFVGFKPKTAITEMLKK